MLRIEQAVGNIEAVVPPHQGVPAPRRGSSRGRPATLLAVAPLAMAVLAIVLAAFVRAAGPAPGAGSALVGHPLPQMELPSERSGQSAGARQLLPHDGRPALVLFVISLCPRCPTEADAVSALARQRGLNLVVIDSPAETAAIADAYATRLGLRGPILLDDSGALATRLGLDTYPALLLVDARGIVRGVWSGETPARTVSAAVDQLAP